MKTQLIMLDIPIIVSDEEITDVRDVKGKWHIEKGYIINQFPDYLTDLSECKVIIAGIEGLPSIDWNGLEEEFGWIDVDDLAITIADDIHENWHVGEEWKCTYLGAVQGFKKAQSLNDKKFSLEDMEGFIDYMYSHKTAHKYKDGYGDFQVFTDLMRQYIQSLQQHKVFDIEVEMEEYDHDEDWSEISGAFEICKYRPKITNNSIKITRRINKTKNYDRLVASRDERILKLEEMVANHKLLDKREEEVSKKERDYRVNELTIKLQAEESKVVFPQDLLSSLVRNTQFKREVFGSDTKVTQDNNGYTQTHPTSFSSTETKTEE